MHSVCACLVYNLCDYKNKKRKTTGKITHVVKDSGSILDMKYEAPPFFLGFSITKKFFSSSMVLLIEKFKEYLQARQF
jgi:hypothetical protein